MRLQPREERGKEEEPKLELGNREWKHQARIKIQRGNERDGKDSERQKGEEKEKRIKENRMEKRPMTAERGHNRGQGR